MIPPKLLFRFPFTQDVWKGNRFLHWPQFVHYADRLAQYLHKPSAGRSG